MLLTLKEEDLQERVQFSFFLDLNDKMAVLKKGIQKNSKRANI